MTWQFRFHPLAKEDYKSAYTWYENQLPGWVNVLEKRSDKSYCKYPIGPKRLVAKAIENSEKQELTFSLF